MWKQIVNKKQKQIGVIMKIKELIAKIFKRNNKLSFSMTLPDGSICIEKEEQMDIESNSILRNEHKEIITNKQSKEDLINLRKNILNQRVEFKEYKDLDATRSKNK